jgi:hypothetical protein
MKRKSEITSHFRRWKTAREKYWMNRGDHIVKAVRADNEFATNDMRSFCNDQGIQLEFTIPYNPQQNGVSEQVNQTAWQKVCPMFKPEAGTAGDVSAIDIWIKLFQTSICLKNISPISAVMDKTPHEVYTGEKPDISHLRVIGYQVWKVLPHTTKTKNSFGMDGRARRNGSSQRGYGEPGAVEQVEQVEPGFALAGEGGLAVG